MSNACIKIVSVVYLLLQPNNIDLLTIMDIKGKSKQAIDQSYKAAYERQKLARAKAELLLETRSRDLYDSKSELEEAYEQLKSQQSQLLHQEKLASIGQLAAGVAHEINNPVGFIKSNLSSLKQYSNDLFELISIYRLQFNDIKNNINNDKGAMIFIDQIDSLEESIDLPYLMEDIPNLINESLSGSERIIKIVSALRTFSRVDSEIKEIVDVNKCIKDTIKLVKNEIKFKAELKLDLGNIPQTMGFPGGIGQVFLNLLLNASQAIPKFGEIKVSTACNENKIIIRVQDNGEGIKEDVKNKIFNAFYTTKSVGVGTGLGLSISAGIIDQHDGDIKVESEIGKGTTFIISIPVLEITQ